MRYTAIKQHPDTDGGYTGAQMGSGRNSGEQEEQSWKDAGKQTGFSGSAADRSGTDKPDDASKKSTEEKGTPKTTRGDEDARGQSGVVNVRK